MGAGSCPGVQRTTRGRRQSSLSTTAAARPQDVALGAVAFLRREVAAGDAVVDVVVRASLLAVARENPPPRLVGAHGQRHQRGRRRHRRHAQREHALDDRQPCVARRARRERRELAVQRGEIEVAFVVQRRLGVGVQAREIELAPEVVDVKHRRGDTARRARRRQRGRELGLAAAVEPVDGHDAPVRHACGRMRQSGVNSWTSAAPAREIATMSMTAAARPEADRKQPAPAPAR